MKKVAILQSSYIPWKGYFDLISAVDAFILYDDMQYTRRDWRNRNKIKTPQGLQWLTVPVRVKGRFEQKISDTEIDGAGWAAEHWKALSLNYGRAACFAEVADWLMPLYLDETYTHLSQLNARLIDAVCAYLGIRTPLGTSSHYRLAEGRSERLADLCRQAGGTVYVSGPSARSYLDEKAFADRGIEVAWFDYSGYPEYPQLWGAFVHEVSIVDLLLNCGKQAPRYMRHVGP